VKHHVQGCFLVLGGFYLRAEGPSNAERFTKLQFLVVFPTKDAFANLLVLVFSRNNLARSESSDFCEGFPLSMHVSRFVSKTKRGGRRVQI
jgi:hypothetical protein